MDREHPELNPHATFLAARMQTVLNGEQGVVKQGDWTVSNLNSPGLLELLYREGAALYGFTFEDTEDVLNVWNIHRQAKKGNGTPSLTSLGDGFAQLARVTGKDVKVLFPKFGQEDTATWLTKNGYRETFDGEQGGVIFVKDFRH